MKKITKILAKTVLLIAIISSCAAQKNQHFSVITPNENNIQDAIKIDLSLEKQDTRENLKEIDLSKSYADAERYFRLASSWERLRCEPMSGFVCTKHECRKIDSKSYLILDKTAKTIKKCNKEICEEFKGQFTQIGVFVNVQSDGGIGSLIRILGDNRYKEVSTVGLDAYISNGNCAALPKTVKK